MRVQHRLQPVPQRGVMDLVHIARRHGGHEVRVHDAAFHEIDCTGAMVVEQPVVCHVPGGIEPHLPQHKFTGDTLVVHVMQPATRSFYDLERLWSVQADQPQEI